MRAKFKWLSERLNNCQKICQGRGWKYGCNSWQYRIASWQESFWKWALKKDLEKYLRRKKNEGG